MVFEEKPNSYEPFGSTSVVAFSTDFIQVIYDAAHSYIAKALPQEGATVTATIEFGKLLEVRKSKSPCCAFHECFFR